MLLRSSAIAAFALLLFVTGCGADDSQSSGDNETTANPVPLAEATDTVENFLATPPQRWGEEAVWHSVFEAEVGIRIQSECTVLPDFECLIRIAEEEDATPMATEFMATYEAILISFRNYGVVDFGKVSAPSVNMGRPSPVFLNGDFGLLYVRALVPRDWHKHPAYSDFTPMAIAWPELAELVHVDAHADGQRFQLKVPVRECRGCQELGYLMLDVAFDSNGAKTGVTVLDRIRD